MTAEPYREFELLFRQHYNELANYAFSILKNRHDAEDVVQDVFIKIWQKDPSIIKADGIKFYLLTATKNSCISFLRKQAGKTWVEPEKAGVANLQEEQVRDAPVDYQALINQALSLLPPQCLVIFKMSRFANLTYKQIADELNLSGKTIENQMGKALKIMREYAKEKGLNL